MKWASVERGNLFIVVIFIERTTAATYGANHDVYSNTMARPNPCDHLLPTNQWHTIKIMAQRHMPERPSNKPRETLDREVSGRMQLFRNKKVRGECERPCYTMQTSTAPVFIFLMAILTISVYCTVQHHSAHTNRMEVNATSATIPIQAMVCMSFQQNCTSIQANRILNTNIYSAASSHNEKAHSDPVEPLVHTFPFHNCVYESSCAWQDWTRLKYLHLIDHSVHSTHSNFLFFALRSGNVGNQRR